MSKSKSYKLNTFTLPNKLFFNMFKTKNWEAIEINFNPVFATENKIKDTVIAVVFCYRSANSNYCPMIIGLNYNYNDKCFIYRQSLFQIIKRSNILGLNSIYLGMEASIEKQKFKAQPLSKSVYLQLDENYNQEIITLMKTQI